jgi:hypothetical protein
MELDQRVARLEEAVKLLHALVIPGQFMDPEDRLRAARLEELLSEMV